jgi:hypothetical protein
MKPKTTKLKINPEMAKKVLSLPIPIMLNIIPEILVIIAKVKPAPKSNIAKLINPSQKPVWALRSFLSNCF